MHRIDMSILCWLDPVHFQPWNLYGSKAYMHGTHIHTHTFIRRRRKRASERKKERTKPLPWYFKTYQVIHLGKLATIRTLRSLWTGLDVYIAWNVTQIERTRTNEKENEAITIALVSFALLAFLCPLKKIKTVQPSNCFSVLFARMYVAVFFLSSTRHPANRLRTSRFELIEQEKHAYLCQFDVSAWNQKQNTQKIINKNNKNRNQHRNFEFETVYHCVCTLAQAFSFHWS